MAIKGIAQFYRHKRHVITSQTDHKCVLDSCRHLQQAGWDVTYLPVQPNGLVDLAQLEVLPPLPWRAVYVLTRKRAGRHPRRHCARVHHGHQQRDWRHAATGGDWSSLPQARRIFPYRCRASHWQSSAGRECVEYRRHVYQWSQGTSHPRGFSLPYGAQTSFAHQIYGPKGVGAIYLRRRPRVRLEPIINGGGQERGLRSGTVPTPLVVSARACSTCRICCVLIVAAQVGLGAACDVARQEMARDEAHVTRLSTRLLEGLRARLSHIVLNGDAAARYPGNLNISFAYVEGESLLMVRRVASYAPLRVANFDGGRCRVSKISP